LIEFIDELLKSGSGKILWRVLPEREQEKIAGTE
jgi:acyl-CoA synthetase (AMP-forming)/AMP-acid ligase II